MLADQGDGQSQAQIENAEKQVAFKEPEIYGADLPHGLCQLDDGDDGEQGGILDDGGKLSGQRRQRACDHLGQDHETPDLTAGKAHRPGSFQLGFLQRKKAAADDLGDVGALKDREDQDTCDKAVVHTPGCADDVKKQIDLHDQRRSAYKFYIDAAKKANEKNGGTLSGSAQNADEKAQDHTADAQPQSGEKTVPYTDAEFPQKSKIKPYLDRSQGDPEKRYPQCRDKQQVEQLF